MLIRLSTSGVAYQLIADDPLINTTQCQLDATLMKELGANAIRVYHVDPLADHTGCMRAFADAGIYLFVDMDSFKTYIKLVRVPASIRQGSTDYVIGCHCLGSEQVGFFQTSHGRLPEVRKYRWLFRGQ
jgi:Glucanosyltransferase